MNNAGEGWIGLVEEMPYDDLRRLAEVNLLGAMDLTRLALPHLLADGGDVVMLVDGLGHRIPLTGTLDREETGRRESCSCGTR